MLHFLTTHLHYPKGLIKVEGGLRYNQLQKRSDILVFDTAGEPLLLVECKASHIPLDEKVCRQLAAYNMAVGARFVAITNGFDGYVWRFDSPNRCYHAPFRITGICKFFSESELSGLKNLLNTGCFRGLCLHRPKVDG